MNLSDFCRRITGPDTRLLPENHKLGARLVCRNIPNPFRKSRRIRYSVRTVASYYAGTSILPVTCMQR